jgi:hypothetical protein
MSDAKPKTPVPMTPLDRQIADAKHRMAHAKDENSQRYWAERVIGLRFERGDFEMISVLTPAIRRALVVALLKEPSP